MKRLGADAPENKILGALLTELRRSAGVTQVELARRLGTDQTLISKIEHGRRSVDLVELASISAVLKVSIAEVVQQFERRLKTST